MKPVDGYVRVSRVGDRAGDSYISPDVQTAAIARFCKERSLELILHDPDENESGGTMDRPVFNLIMRRIRDGESGGIVVYRLDRFARNLVSGYTLLTEIAERGGVFGSASEPQFDFTTSSGRLTLQVHLMMAEYFREVQKESWAATVRKAVDRGIHVAGYGAFGYDRVDRRFVPNDEAPYIVEAFERRAGGEPLEAIADWLNAQAGPCRTVRRGVATLRPWTGGAVRRMLARRVYLGEAFSGRTRNEEAHEPLVTAELYDAAQRSTRTWTNTRRHDDTPDHLLAGVVRCAGCRYVMSVRRNVARNGSVRYFHTCRKHRTSGVCPEPAMVDAERVETYVEELVTAELDRRAHTWHGHHATDQLDAATARRDAARADVEAVRSDTTARRRLGDDWLSWVEPYVAALERAEREVAQLLAESRSSVHGLTSDTYRALPRPARRAALGEMIDVVFVRRGRGPTRGPQAVPLDSDRVRVLWRGQGPDDLPAPSRFATDGLRHWDGFAEREAPARVEALQVAADHG